MKGNKNPHCTPVPTDQQSTHPKWFCFKGVIMFSIININGSNKNIGLTYLIDDTVTLV